jgi:hypothetical protein
MATKKQIEGWIKQVQKRMDGVAAERDKIDSVLEELAMLKDSCERAYDNLQNARDALSELV